MIADSNHAEGRQNTVMKKFLSYTMEAFCRTQGRRWPGGLGVRTPSLDQTTHEIRANPGTSAGDMSLKGGRGKKEKFGCPILKNWGRPWPNE
jgi:hypothetical protein